MDGSTPPKDWRPRLLPGKVGATTRGPRSTGRSALPMPARSCTGSIPHNFRRRPLVADLDDGLDHARLRPGVRREHVDNLLKRDAMRNPRPPVDAALLDPPDHAPQPLSQR